MGEVRALLGAVTIGALGAQRVSAAAGAGTGLGLRLAAAASAVAGATAARRAPRRRGALVVGAALFLGAAAGRARLDAVRHAPLPATHVARLVLPRRGSLIGRVVATPSRRGAATVVVLDALRVGDAPASGRVRLTVRGALPKLRAGDDLRVATTLRRPRGFANPGSFDIAGHLARRGILVTASAWDVDDVVRVPRATRGLRVRLERWRQRLLHAIARAVPDDAGAVLQALVLGEQGGIAPELRDAFARAGVVHLLSVSGLHVGLVAAVGFVGARWLLGRSTRLLLAVDVRAVAALVGLAPVALYVALAGAEVATVRSALMATCAAVALAIGRRLDVLRALALAALALALAWPGSPREIGFQLSFASVLAIALGAARWAPATLDGWRARVRAGVVVTLAALVGTAPLSARHFQQVSVAGAVANPIAIPLFGSAVVLLGLGGALVEPLAPGTAAAAFRVAGTLLRPGLAVVRALGTPAWAAVTVATPSVVELTLVWAALGAILAWPRPAARALLAAALLGLAVDAAWWLHVRTTRARLRVTFLDVGQGDAAVVELPGGAVVVVDAGGFPGSDFDVGGAVVLPFLHARKILHVDALALTHGHPDHMGGMASLVRTTAPPTIWRPPVPGRGVAWDRLVAAWTAAGVRDRVLRRGDALPGWAAGVTVLHPPGGWPGDSLNDASLVLRAALGDVAILLTGDVEAGGEAAMRAAGAPLAAAVVKVPHHGSRTSSSAAFVAAAAPAVAVISVGADNRYRLPAADVEARWAARGACVLRTDRCGAITVETDGAHVATTTFVPSCGCGGGTTPTPPP